ncbi:hypothetical protein DMH04_54125 [Kibdelosporangium aridum]|uniref:Uncharacterized protein n=1 Tax=Kibdelosporangium aridum TaxID=2030 RepID=A0A428XYF1_KIBAR|nr:DUF6069 family protein [Kibdelosporangium aridum]RSM60386.1 hypothetical protein DMH04_54125 [Kibdelosporangium aridum]
MNAVPRSRTGQLDVARLWSGGVATAVVAGLIAVVGILVSRGVLDVPVLSPEGEGVWGDANTVTYALVSGAVALAATGLLQLLSVTTPRFQTFFTWIMGLLTAIAVVVPLSLPVSWESKLATALINLVIGIAITSILNGVARSAYRRRRRPPEPPPGDGPTSWPDEPPPS